MKRALIILAVGLAGLIGALVFFRFDSTMLTALLLTFALYFLVLFSPAIYLHLSYFTHNRFTLLTTDKAENKIVIQTLRNSWYYTFYDIEKCELNLGIYYKNEIDWVGRKAAPWTNYAYLAVKFKDKKEFFFTSLMFDFTLLKHDVNTVPFKVDAVRFRLFPYLDKVQPDIKTTKNSNGIEVPHRPLQLEKVEQFEQRFAKLSEDTLMEKINNPKYEPEAKRASENILEQRRKRAVINNTNA